MKYYSSSFLRKQWKLMSSVFFKAVWGMGNHVWQTFDMICWVQNTYPRLAIYFFDCKRSSELSYLWISYSCLLSYPLLSIDFILILHLVPVFSLICECPSTCSLINIHQYDQDLLYAELDSVEGKLYSQCYFAGLPSGISHAESWTLLKKWLRVWHAQEQWCWMTLSAWGGGRL